MTKPIRVQLRRTKGWKMPENTVKADRTTKWGNPFIPGKEVPVLLEIANRDDQIKDIENIMDCVIQKGV